MSQFSTLDDVRTALLPPTVDHEALIVGAGFGGLAAAIGLRRRGIDDFVILERHAGIGGTWFANRYPGVAVDIASPTYSFSFAPNPDWTRLHAPGAELQAYAEKIADEYDLRSHVRLNSNVASATWNEEAQHWVIEIDGQSPVTARLLFMASGILSQPKVPDIPGMQTFRGSTIHTAQWDESFEPNQQRIALIGTGASAVQALPILAARAAQVTVFQRTPIWVTPKPDAPVPRPVREVFRRLPVTQRLLRYTNAAWIETLAASFGYYEDIPWLLPRFEELSRLHLRLQVKDPEIRKALTPDYDFWCKRPTFSNDYYRSFNRSNVELVTDPIARITKTGITTSEGARHPFDTIVLATGFALQEDGNFPPFPVVGRNGVDMGTWFREHGYQSYEGITVAGFPNLFYLSGPFSFTGLSFFYQAESQMAHVKRVLDELDKRHATVFEVKAHAQERFVKEMDQAVGRTVWAHGNCSSANSYYFNEHGENRLGRIMPTLKSMWRDRHFPLADYRFEPAPDPLLRSA